MATLAGTVVSDLQLSEVDVLYHPLGSGLRGARMLHDHFCLIVITVYVTHGGPAVAEVFVAKFIAGHRTHIQIVLLPVFQTHDIKNQQWKHTSAQEREMERIKNKIKMIIAALQLFNALDQYLQNELILL